MLTINFPESATPVAVGEDLVVYADEQGSANRNAGQNFAVGYVFEPVANVDRLVEGALRSGGADLRAVRRGYFHASADCPASRAVLARAIEDDGAPLFFGSLRWNFKAAMRTQPHKGELHRHALSLALNRITQRKGVRRIEIRFARVQGLNEQTITRWFAEDVDVRLRLLESLAGLPMYFPAIAAREVEPKEAGIQVADHLLWTEQRAAEKGGDALESVGLSLDYKTEPDNAFVISNYVRRGTALAQTRSRPLVQRVPEMPWGDWFNLFVGIERIVHQLAVVRPPPIMHLAPIIDEASRTTRERIAIGGEHVDAICRAFLVAVDTLPAYDVDDAEQARAASNAALVAASILRKRESWTVSVVDRWLDVRRNAFTDAEAARYLFARDIH